MKKYTNGEFTGTYKECCKYLNASLPRNHVENWPDGPWEEVRTTVEPTLDQRREQKRQELKFERDSLIKSPINGVQVATSDDRENIEGSVSDWGILYGSLDEISWVLEDNTTTPLSKQDLEEIISLYKTRKRDAFAIYTQLLLQLNQSDSPEEIVWPE